MPEINALLDQLAPYKDYFFPASLVLLTLLATIYVVIGAVHAGSVRRLVREQRELIAAMQAQAEAAIRPYIEVRTVIDPVTLLLVLQIRNGGRSAARDLRLSLDRPFYQFGQKREERNIARFHAFAQVVPSLAPGQELAFHLGTGASIFGENRRDDLTPSVFAVTARYRDDAGRELADETTVDLRALLMGASMATPLKQELEAINKSVQEAAAALQEMARAYREMGTA